MNTTLNQLVIFEAVLLDMFGGFIEQALEAELESTSRI